MIPILKPALPEFEKVKDELKECFDSGQLIMGKNVGAFEKEVANYLGVKHAITTASCSTALILVLNTLKKNSEVILPSFTFSATVQAVVWNNLKPVLVDCDRYCNIDVEEVKKNITKNTSAILGVHIFGSPCNVEALEKISKENNIKLFFDAAHAFGSKYKGKHIGQFGDAEIFSLGVTKAFACGEGGLVTTNDDKLANHVRLSANNGRPAGSINPSVLGMSSRFQEFNAIIGRHNLKVIDEHIKRRNKLAEIYKEKLKTIPGINFCPVPNNVVTTFKDFVIFIDKENFGMSRDELGEFLTKNGVQIKYYFYPPIHKVDFFKDMYKDKKFPNTDKLSSTTISLPFFTNISLEEIGKICDLIKKAQNEIRKKRR